MKPGAEVPLFHAIGRLALVGLVLNAVIGSSVFGLPSVVAARLGSASPWAWLATGAMMTLVVACFAEVASRFRQAGGPYLYVRVALGQGAGIQMAWLTYLVRITAAATNANLFVIYLAEFWPSVTGPVESRVVLGLVLLPLAIANYRGVGAGLNVSNAFTVAKLLPLGVFVLAGLGAVVAGGHAAPAAMSGAGAGGWLEVMLLLVFAYGGFEAALLPLGEAKNPRRDAPIALFAALGICALIYTLVQAVVVAELTDPGASPRPLAAAAQVTMGPAGALLMAVGALVSVYGYLAGAVLNVPRLTYALAEQGDLPRRFGALHPRFRTPHLSVVLFTALVWVFAAAGSFLENLTLSAISRLATYGAVCVVLVVLRYQERRDPKRVEPAWFRVPGGIVVPFLGLAFTAVLALRISQRELAVLAATLAAGLLHQVWMRRR
ncbi:MAG TPA: APC family permease [Gemmatimonadales bacterium]|nr:APC family permease [Gemmatimonadales bacterium]